MCQEVWFILCLKLLNYSLRCLRIPLCLYEPNEKSWWRLACSHWNAYTCIVFLCLCCSDHVLACMSLPELAPWAEQPDFMCVCLFAGAVTCLWLNIHVPSGHAQVCSCLTSVSICSNMLLFVLRSVFCLYLPNTQTILLHTYMPTGCCMYIEACCCIWPLRPLVQFHHL